jgi:hypothetical protein
VRSEEFVRMKLQWSVGGPQAGLHKSMRVDLIWVFFSLLLSGF